MRLSIFISVINQLHAQNFCFTLSLFHASTCFEHYVLIIRRSKLHYKACGIITPVGSRLVRRLREDYSIADGCILCSLASWIVAIYSYVHIGRY